MQGKLYIIPTPIGNLKDITLRALETLKYVDLIAAEDTRQTLKLLNHFDIKKTLVSYHEHNEVIKVEKLIDTLREGKNIGLVSDAGTPGISDPGSVIIKACIENNISFEVLPGATAITTAVVYSGLSTKSFSFIGFLPRNRKEKREALDMVKDYTQTLVFYEAPHRLRDTLAILNEVLGNRNIAICRELTKMYEEIIRDTIENTIIHYSNNEPRGEYVLVVDGISEELLKQKEIDSWSHMSLKEHIVHFMESGLSKKDAIKAVAKEREMPKSEVYTHSLDI